ncbi:MAG: cellulase family glycosylhydrolase [Firmicutes bacterium]|nr:cellulase family glycosylhydrolase [Bacillota bacterium]
MQEIEFNFTNNSDAEITDWTGTIEFDTDVKGINSWNDTFNYEGKKVTISPIEWNKNVKPGETKIINFHIKTSLPVKVTSAAASTNAGNAEMSKPKTEENAKPSVIASNEDPSKTPVGIHGQLSVSGTKIVDKNGTPVILQGVSTHGIAWFPQYVDKEGFRTLRDTMGVNTIRLALYSSTNEGYSSAMHQKVINGVEYAKELGMYVIIDWHILANGNPNTDKAAAKTFFTEMTGKFKDYDNVIYEICNEPNGGTTWENDIKPYANEMISLIRQQDDDAIIIVGTPTWSQDVDIAAKSPITGQKNIMYALHFYSATHKQDLRNKLASAISAGLPVFVTEFGISEASGAGNIDEAEGTNWINYLRNNGISYVCWNLSNKDEACALIKSGVTKTSGWTDDDLTQEGKWLKKTYTTK